MHEGMSKAHASLRDIGQPNIDVAAPHGFNDSLSGSIRCHLENQIKQHRDTAFKLESLLRELPQMSGEASAALWAIMMK
jgi:hypothetical protein